MWTIMKKYFSFAGSYRGKLTKGLVFSFLNSLCEAFQVLALVYVLQALVFNTISWTTVWVSLAIMLVSIVGCIFLGHFSNVYKVNAGFNMCGEKRIEIGDRMRYMPMGYFNENSLGSIVGTLTNVIEDLQDIGSRVIVMVIPGMIYSFVISLMILVFDWRIGLVVLCGIVLFLGALSLLQKASQKASPARMASQAAIVTAVLEYIQGMSVVRAFNTAGNAEKAVKAAINECEKQNVAIELKFLPYAILQSVILKVTCVVISLVSVVLFLTGNMESFVCLMMIIVSFIVYNKLEAAGQFSALLRQIDLGIDKVQLILDTPTFPEPRMIETPSSFTIEVDSVSFSYEKRRVIDKVSISIPQKSTVAIVGPSGSGKTTICNLIARFWDVDSGTIRLGGIDIRRYAYDDLLACFSFVFQNVYLFNDTIENNIKFGKPDATHEEVVSVAKLACCHEFIEALPQGYQTMIGEGGATISGGEKQRISIARAMLKDAPIIILDEATANVDPENERELQRAIEGLTKDKTVIMIAHRLKTVRHADQIIVMDQGRISQQGTHAELMAQGGLYANFVYDREKAISWKLATN